MKCENLGAVFIRLLDCVIKKITMIEKIEDMLIEVSDFCKNHNVDEEKAGYIVGICIRHFTSSKEFCKCKDGATGRTVTEDFNNQICDNCGNISK